MTQLRWSPWNELENMQRQLSHVFDGVDIGRENTSGRWLPAVDIRETEDALIVAAELAGIDKKDIKIGINDGVLTISGERRFEKEVDEKNAHRIERAYGSFERSFSLPTNIDASKVDAKMDNGVLTLTLHKHEGARPREISIQ